MCNACFDDNKIATTTTFTVEYKDCIIIIRHVPCLECQVCGEITYSSEVATKLEKLVDDAKKVMQEVAVIDYNKAA